jgi:hypothetical protein
MKFLGLIFVLILFMIGVCLTVSPVMADLDANVTAQIVSNETISTSLLLIFLWVFFVILSEYRKDLIFSIIVLALSIFGYYDELLKEIKVFEVSLPLVMFFIAIYMIGMSMAAIFKRE